MLSQSCVGILREVPLNNIRLQVMVSTPIQLFTAWRISGKQNAFSASAMTDTLNT